MKVRILLMSVLATIVLSPIAIAEDEYVDETETSWGSIAKDDGFSKTFTIFKTADNYGISDFGDDIEYTIEIQCTKKRLAVLAYGDPGIFPETGLGFKGTAQMKVGNGKVTKQSFSALKDFSGVSFNSPKSVTTAILKGKTTFSFKIPSSVQNDAVMNFTIHDLPSYRSKFKSLGCSLS